MLLTVFLSVILYANEIYSRELSTKHSTYAGQNISQDKDHKSEDALLTVAKDIRKKSEDCREVKDRQFSGNPMEEIVSSVGEARQDSGIHIYPGSPVYDSLLTRRTYVPSLKMVLLELSLMTLSVFVLNVFENMMAAQKKNRKPIKQRTRQLDENILNLHYL